MLWLEVKNNKQKSFLLCYCYRPPSASNVWIENFEEAIERANLEAKEIIVIGDFNFNRINDTGSSKQWIRLTDSLNLTQLVKKPTRVTATSETLIDHVYSNTQGNIIDVSVPVLAISDHYPVCILCVLPENYLKHLIPVLFTNLLILGAQKHLLRSNFFMALLTYLMKPVMHWITSLRFSFPPYKRMLPRRKSESNDKKQPNWINAEILTAMKIRDQLRKIKNNTQYAHWRNKVRALIPNS